MPIGGGKTIAGSSSSSMPTGNSKKQAGSNSTPTGSSKKQAGSNSTPTSPG